MQLRFRRARQRGVFISYRNKDASLWAIPIRLWLINRGYDVFLDQSARADKKH
jgi:hypothetical protein